MFNRFSEQISKESVCDEWLKVLQVLPSVINLKSSAEAFIIKL